MCEVVLILTGSSALLLLEYYCARHPYEVYFILTFLKDYIFVTTYFFDDSLCNYLLSLLPNNTPRKLALFAKRVTVPPNDIGSKSGFFRAHLMVMLRAFWGISLYVLGNFPLIGIAKSSAYSTTFTQTYSSNWEASNVFSTLLQTSIPDLYSAFFTSLLYFRSTVQ